MEDKLWEITNARTGYSLGMYRAKDRQGALDTMAEAAGYSSWAAACDVTGEYDHNVDEVVED